MTIVPATDYHCVQLAARMRPADALETLRSSGNLPLASALLSVKASREAWAVIVDEKLLAIFGVVPHGEAAVCWTMTSTDVDVRPLAFWRASKEIVRDLRSRWPVLFNFIDAEYTAALSWARRLGFDVGDPEAFGVQRLPFRRVTLRS